MACDTPSPVRRRVRAEDSREAVMEAAMALFLRRGLSATMDEVAGAARISKRTLYQIARNKLDLYVNVVEWLYAKGTSRSLALPSEIGLAESLTRYGLTLHAYYSTASVGQFLRLLDKEKERIPNLERSLRVETIRKTVHPLQRYLEATRAQLADTVEPGVAATIFVRSIISELIDFYLVHDRPPALEEFRPFLDALVMLHADGLRRRAPLRE